MKNFWYILSFFNLYLLLIGLYQKELLWFIWLIFPLLSLPAALRMKK